MRRSKILCTLGPASDDVETLRRLVDAGMDAVRLNFSHGDADSHRRTMANVRAVAAATGRPLPVLQDLQGPRIRVGEIDGPGLELVEGAEIVARPGAERAAPGELPITYAPLADDVVVGDAILIADGLLRLAVLEVGADPYGPLVRCVVRVGGTVTSHKGVNLPGVRLSTPALTEKDREDAAVGAAMGVDLVALSFVRHPDDIRELRAVLREHGSAASIVAKIERPEALEHLEGILDASDGVMVARGDLGVELPPQRVPLEQRHIVEDANAAGKLVIIATQMLDSMIRNPLPTRAEVSDVATAVMQGADAMMLSGETAVGAYPVAAVRMMADIIAEVEGGLRRFDRPPEPALIPGIAWSASAVGRAAVRTARDVEAACLAVFTNSGRTASLVSDYRPEQPILAFTTRPEVHRRMGLLWGVLPILVPDEPLTLDGAARIAATTAQAHGHVAPGQRIVLTMGQPSGPGRQTNLLWVWAVEG